MRLLTTETFLFIVFFAEYARSELHPDGINVCLVTENYEETVLVRVQKRKTVRTKTTWCWFRRCHKERVYYENEPKVFSRTRVVPKCCDGYKEKISTNYCVPECTQTCEHGICIAPNTCSCEDGFTGPTCNEECPNGRWGKGCSFTCTCSEHGHCDSTKGCVCDPGWIGYQCDISSREGHNGSSYDLGCNLEIGLCNTTVVNETSVGNVTSTDVSETRTESDHTERKNEVSKPTELYEVLASEANTESLSVSLMNSPEDEATYQDEVIFGIATEKKAKLSQVTEPIQSINEGTDPIELGQFVEKDTTQKASSEETLNEKEVKFHLQSEINFLEDLDALTKNPRTEETQVTDYINEAHSGKILNESDIGTDETFSLTGIDRIPIAAKNEIDNVNSETENSLKNHSHTKFFASLSIISGMSLIIFIIAGKWLIVSHRRNVKKILMATTKAKILHLAQLKPQEKKTIWANSFTKNPTHVSDAGIINGTPILTTFKAVTKSNC